MKFGHMAKKIVDSGVEFLIIASTNRNSLDEVGSGSLLALPLLCVRQDEPGQSSLLV